MAEVERVSSWWCGTVRVDHVTCSEPDEERYTISCGRERMQMGPREYRELRSCMEGMGREGYDGQR